MDDNTVNSNTIKDVTTSIIDTTTADDKNDKKK